MGGGSDSQLYDKYTNWDPSKRTFFLNEIEPSSTTYFVRWLKFDCMPMYGKLYAAKARVIHKHLQGSPAKVGKRSPASAGKKAMKTVIKTKLKAKGSKAKK